MLKIFNSVTESDEFSSRDNWNGFSSVSSLSKYTDSGTSSYNYTFFKRSKYLDKDQNKLADSNATIELPKIRHSFLHLVKYDRYDPAKSRFLHCDLCSKLLIDTPQNASTKDYSCFRCTECGYLAHPGCLASVPANCYPATDLYWWSHVPRGSADNQKKSEPNFEKMEMASTPGTDIRELVRVWFTHSERSMVATDYEGHGFGVTIAPPPTVNFHLGVVLQEPHLVDPIGPPLTEKLVRDVCFGAAHTIFLCTDGSLYSIGRNYEGQLGLGSDVENSPQPRLVIDLASKVVSKISCGGNHNIALTQDNEIYVWGDGRNGRLGDGTDETKFKPTKLKLNIDQIKQSPCFIGGSKTDLRDYPITIVRCGWSHTMVVVETPTFLDTSGNPTSFSYLFTFGRGQWGQCGHGVTRDENRPKLVESFKYSKITDISGGYYHSAVLVNEYEISDNNNTTSIRTSNGRKNSSPEFSFRQITRGRVYCFGYGGEGQCGQGPDNLQHQLSPQLVHYLAGQEVTSVACGGFHTIALVSPPVVASTPTTITAPLSLAYFWGGINGETVSIPKVISQLSDKNIISVKTAMFQTIAVCVHTPVMTSANVIPPSPMPVREVQTTPKEAPKTPQTPKGSTRDFYRNRSVDTPPKRKESAVARDMTNSVVTPITPFNPPAAPSTQVVVTNPHLISGSQYLLYRVLYTIALKKPLEAEVGSLSVRIEDYSKTAQQKKIQLEKFRLAQLRLEQRKKQYEFSLSRLNAEKEKAQKLRETCQLRRTLLDQATTLLENNKTTISNRAALLYEKISTIQHQNEAIEVYRNKLLQYISQIFPIERISNVEYTICDLVLPNLDNLDKLFLEAGNFLKDPYNFKKYDKEMIANSVGYVIQLLELVSKYIEFPFIYDMRFLGSRSCIMDPVTTDNIQIFPLYVPQKIEHFNYALTLLHQNLDQVLRSRGIDCLNLGWTLPNVQKLLLGENASIPLKQDKDSDEHSDNNNHTPQRVRKSSQTASTVTYTVNFSSPALVMPSSPHGSTNNIAAAAANGLKNSPK